MALTTRARRRRGRAAGVVATLAAAALPFCRPAPVHAQADPVPTRSGLVAFSSYGKWATLAGAAGFTTLAIFRNDDADEIFRGLRTLCRSAPEECRLTASGAYVGADAERLYQETLRLDRQARAWMIAGQVTLAASGILFLIDLVSDDGGPANIPFTPFEVYAEPRELGLRVRF